MATVNVVVTCTKRKGRPVAPRQMLRTVPDGRSIKQRAASWLNRLQGGGEATPVIDLYAGDHWSVVRSIAVAHEEAPRARLWVCSAGYGLVPLESHLLPYSA